MTPAGTITSFDEIAFHEAGHAVSALDEGATLGVIRLEGKTKPARTTIYDFERLPPRAQIMIAQSGTASQIVRRLARCWDGLPPVPTGWFSSDVLTVNARSDAVAFKKIIGAERKGEPDNALMVGALGAAIRYVAAPPRWGRIEAVAKALRFNGELSGHDVEHIAMAASESDDERLQILKIIAVQEIAALL